MRRENELGLKLSALTIDTDINELKNWNNFNKISSIVFATPEIGKWSTVGGLGYYFNWRVMVDELSQGLAALNENVYVISPYYHRNKKGDTDYLRQDNIHHEFNMRV